MCEYKNNLRFGEVNSSIAYGTIFYVKIDYYRSKMQAITDTAAKSKFKAHAAVKPERNLYASEAVHILCTVLELYA